MADEIVLSAEPGRAEGSRPARRLRALGQIPAVVYGNGVAPRSVSVDARSLRAALSTNAGLNAVLTLQVGGDSYTTMARSLQRHPVRGTVVHVDFQVVDPNREISAEVPIILVGDPVELTRADGVLDQQLFSLPVKARPSDIPPNVEADIGGLAIGSAVRVADIALPGGVTCDLDPESVVAAGQAPRVVEVAPAAEAEALEGEEAAPAPGEAAPAVERAEGESGGEEG